MFLYELFEKKLTELNPGFVHSQIELQRDDGKKVWQHKGTGATASVWQHYSDPNTVVKVVGGGDYEAHDAEREVTLAFVHFLVDHGYQSKHYPIVHGINIDDDEVLQVRIETLQEIPNTIVGSRVSQALHRLASNLEYNPAGVKQAKNALNQALSNNPKWFKMNTADSIEAAIQYLIRALPVYSDAHQLVGDPHMNLHPGNWLMRADGTIVAADPWYADDEDAGRSYYGTGSSENFWKTRSDWSGS